MTTWGHDPAVVLVSNLLLTVNDALTHSAVLVQVCVVCVCLCVCEVLYISPQGHGWREEGQELTVPFPFDRDDEIPIPEGTHKRTTTSAICFGR